jgi:hypothetical protein
MGGRRGKLNSLRMSAQSTLIQQVPASAHEGESTLSSASLPLLCLSRPEMPHTEIYFEMLGPVRDLRSSVLVEADPACRPSGGTGGDRANAAERAGPGVSTFWERGL